jgi:hypothetical protein
VKYRLLDEFENLFSGKFYNHRVYNNGDYVAVGLYEDLLHLKRSPKYARRVAAGTSVVNFSNVSPGIAARRADGTFGQNVPHVDPNVVDGYAVLRGTTATVEIGVEVKIVCKAMLRQIGRVMNDLKEQASELQLKNVDAVRAAVVGVNFAPFYVSFEGDREWRTTGHGKHKHPVQEADEVVSRLRARVAPLYDELLVLPFIATNDPPYDFAWVDSATTQREYGAALVRLSQLYEKRF